MQLLVERGADPSLSGGVYGNPLHAAAIEGRTSTVQYLLDIANVPWSLVDRRLVTRVSASRLDAADALLQECHDPQTIADDAEEGCDEEEEETDTAEEMYTGLTLDVESIPGACEPYKVASRWNAVRESSLHLLAQTSLKAEIMGGTLFTDKDSKQSGKDGAGAPQETTPRMLSLLKSKSVPVNKIAEIGPPSARTWDSSALDWLEV